MLCVPLYIIPPGVYFKINECSPRQYIIVDEPTIQDPYYVCEAVLTRPPYKKFGCFNLRPDMLVYVDSDMYNLLKNQTYVQKDSAKYRDTRHLSDCVQSSFWQDCQENEKVPF